jgi:isochorismate synthase
MDAPPHENLPCPSAVRSCPEFGFFSTETQLLVRSSSRLSPSGASWAELAERALGGAAREDASSAVVVGALPFEAGSEASLSLARECITGANARTAVLEHDAASNLLTSGLAVERPRGSGYEQAVRHALAAIDVGQLDKVVLARAVDYPLAALPCRGALLSRLLRFYPSAHVFVCRLEPTVPGPRTFLGASPELLVAKRGQRVRSHPLAGSAPRYADPQLDRARAEALLSCSKNRREHAFVVDAVASVLAPWCSELHVPKEPTLVPTPTVWHLGTPIRGTLRSSDVSSLALAEALHPTPAVCGYPRAVARACIRELEAFDRGFYAGAVGYCDVRGDGEWAVAIRCAEISGHELRLYAGAGIVAGAEPALELEETSAKLSTMVDALGLSHLEQVA